MSRLQQKVGTKPGRQNATAVSPIDWDALEVRPGYPTPRISYEVTDCSVPVALDTYSFCAYGCAYCFSQFQKTFSTKYKRVVEYADPESVWKRMTARGTPIGEYIASGRAFQWGSLSDPLDDFEQKFGKTLDLMRFFKAQKLQNPCTFSTKATWWAFDDRYREAIQGMPWHLKMSIITADDEAASDIERWVPPPSERFKALAAVKGLFQLGTILRFRPFIIGVSDKTMEEVVRRGAEAGVRGISTEFLCLDPRHKQFWGEPARILERWTGYSIKDFYKAASANGFWRLNWEVKKPYLYRLAELCKKYNLELYVSDNHGKWLCHHGSCCGLPKGTNYAFGQWTKALEIARERGYVTWQDMEPHLKVWDLEFQRTTFNKGRTENMAGYRRQPLWQVLKRYWNDPKNNHSPYQMFVGKLKPKGLDESGNIIYAWQDEP
jgi:DNA repair photolyase